MKGILTILILLCLAGGGGLIFARRAVHGVLGLVVVFVAVAGCFLALGAQFLALVQLLVYVGAVAILTIFAVMLTQNREPETRNRLVQPIPIGLGIAGLVTGILLVFVGPSFWKLSVIPTSRTEPLAQIGKELLGPYVVPLEALVVLLTVALIGAALITVRGARQPSWPPPLAPGSPEKKRQTKAKKGSNHG